MTRFPASSRTSTPRSSASPGRRQSSPSHTCSPPMTAAAGFTSRTRAAMAPTPALTPCVTTTNPALESELTGSRSHPRGSSRSSNGLRVASIITMSKSRASRRCWNPSSSTTTSVPPSAATSAPSSGPAPVAPPAPIAPASRAKRSRSPSTRFGCATTGTDANARRYASSSSLRPPARAPYPRIAMHGRRPISISIRTTSPTIGLFPVPPTDRFPTLITGRSSVTTPRPASKARFRRAISQPYSFSPSIATGASHVGSGPRGPARSAIPRCPSGFASIGLHHTAAPRPTRKPPPSEKHARRRFQIAPKVHLCHLRQHFWHCRPHGA